MEQLKIGVIGGYRGSSMIKFLKNDERARVTVICDKNDEILESQKEMNKGYDVAYCKDYDEMLKMDVDAVVLANYATEHAPFAIKALRAGKHVYSEVLPCQTLKEAVELIEAVEETGKVYAYGENYCFMPAPREMRKLYREGKLGEFEYGEGEYVHNCVPIWHSITYGEKDHWRNRLYSTFYCTHSIGPLIHITGLRPVSVVGFEGTYNKRNDRVGALGGSFGEELITLENGGIIKSLHGHLYGHSIWYSVYGTKGRAESAREDTGANVEKIYVNVDEHEEDYANNPVLSYYPEVLEKAKDFGHGGSDYYTMDNFIKELCGDDSAEIIDVYEALDMFLPGMMAYRSILKGGIPVEIPNLRDKAEREKYRNDVACTDPKIAKDQLLPSRKSGTPNIPDEVYDEVRKKYLDGLNNGDPYMNAVFNKHKKNKK